MQVLKRSGSGLGVESSRFKGDSSFEAIGIGITGLGVEKYFFKVI